MKNRTTANEDTHVHTVAQRINTIEVRKREREWIRLIISSYWYLPVDSRVLLIAVILRSMLYFDFPVQRHVLPDIWCILSSSDGIHVRLLWKEEDRENERGIRRQRYEPIFLQTHFSLTCWITTFAMPPCWMMLMMVMMTWRGRIRGIRGRGRRG